MPEQSAEEFLAGQPLGLAALGFVREALADRAVAERVTQGQVAFRRRRGFAWLWLPGQYLHRPGADVVLSVALGRLDPSPRWKEVAHPSPQHWQHHLELHAEADLDDEVAGWLVEACDRAG